ncbi:MAG: DUF6268 family outer membrane beta-barrel protein [Myxococcota bacterium]
MRTQSTSVSAPLPLLDHTFLLAGVDYEATTVGFDGVTDADAGLTKFFSSDARLFAVHQFEAPWTLAAGFTIGLAGDFAAVDSSMVRGTAIAYTAYQYDLELSFGGGLALDYSFGQLLPLPLLSLDWEADWGTVVSLLLPASFDVLQRFGDRFEVGIVGDLGGTSFAVRGGATADRWPCVASVEEGPSRPELCLDNVAYSTITVGPTAALRLVSTLWLDATFGYYLYRRFEGFNANGDSLPGGTTDLERTFFVRAGLTVRLPELDDE